MGYFGTGAFESDQGLDWLGDTKAASLPSRIEKTLLDYASFDEDSVPVLSQEEMQRRVDRLVDILRSCSVPPEQKKKYGSKKAWIEAVRQNAEAEYSSGRYRELQYGPVEEMLAACELLCCWGGQFPDTGLTERERRRVMRLLKDYRDSHPPQQLLDSAKACVDKARKSRRYIKMRAYFLAASAGLGVDDDDMEAVNDLRQRLERVVS